MADGKIYITISDNSIGESGAVGGAVGGGDNKNTSSDKNRTDSIIGKYATQQFFNLVKSQAQAQVNYEISKIGNLKGEYTRQHNIETTINIGRQLISIGESAIAGFTLTGGNPIGALIGAVASAGGTALSYVRQEDMIAKQTAITNFQIRYLQERSGLYSLNNGSRGTDN